MYFHTWIFGLFFLIFYPVYLAVKGTRVRLPWLLVASYVFYGWCNPRYLDPAPLRHGGRLPASCSAWRGPGWKKPWLPLSIVNNLAAAGLLQVQHVPDRQPQLAAGNGSAYPMAFRTQPATSSATGSMVCLHAVGIHLHAARAPRSCRWASRSSSSSR